MYFSSEIFVQIISFAFIVIMIFLALRAFALWYWRFGEMANSLLEINKNIKLLASEHYQNTEAKNNTNLVKSTIKDTLNETINIEN